MKGPPLGPGEENITLPDHVPHRGRQAPTNRKIKPQISHLQHALQPQITHTHHHRPWMTHHLLRHHAPYVHQVTQG